MAMEVRLLMRVVRGGALRRWSGPDVRILWGGVVVGGSELSGMSTRVVMPPAAAARVALQNPSQSVRPG
ncbi:hypothetical protein, partial [Streptomyces sp. NPDC060205]|uniref:hypothetical protein n=1 Tax=Streptomyces sp. NPDC060205 TaxID=3347072 RepID=UPI0036690ED1